MNGIAQREVPQVIARFFLGRELMTHQETKTGLSGSLPLSEHLIREMDGNGFGPSRQLQNSSPRIIILLTKGIRYLTLTHSG